VRVLGIDPGFASLGWCEASSSLGGLAFVKVGAIHTTPDKSKTAARDLFDRFAYLADELLYCTSPELLCIEGMRQLGRAHV